MMQMFGRYYASLKTFASNKTNLAWTGAGAAGLGMATVMAYRFSVNPVEPPLRPDGDPKSSATTWLEMESKLFQKRDPLSGTHIYFAGFHPMKNDPTQQTEVHHYCKQVNEDFSQCLLYDGNTRNANLTGVEYVISDKLYRQLPQEECSLWHPHNYEVISGQLLAPGLPTTFEKKLLTKRLNTYGKTFHTWRPSLDNTLPKGEPNLGWSFTSDGQLKSGLSEGREKLMGVKNEQKKREREGLAKAAKHQINAVVAKPPPKG